MTDDRPTLTVHVGDLHVGSSVALSPERYVMADGNLHGASELQLWYLEHWRKFWRDTAELKARHGAFCVGFFGGDLRDGDHHGTTQLCIPDEDDQDEAVLEIVSEADDVLDAEAYINGTPSHGGPASAADERYARTRATRDKRLVIGREVGGKPRWSWWSFAQVVGGKKFDIAHAPGTKSWVPHTKEITAARHAQYTWEEYVKAGKEPPDFVIRHHVHYKAGPGHYEGVNVFFIPAWQAGSNWVKSRGVKAPLIYPPGGLRLLIWPDGRVDVYWKTYEPPSGVGW